MKLRLAVAAAALGFAPVSLVAAPPVAAQHVEASTPRCKSWPSGNAVIGYCAGLGSQRYKVSTLCAWSGGAKLVSSTVGSGGAVVSVGCPKGKPQGAWIVLVT